MIRKLPIINQQEFESPLGQRIVEILNHFASKTNELVDAVNTIQKEREAERFEIQEWIGILEAVRKSVNAHKKQIDELQMKLRPIIEERESGIKVYEETMGMVKRNDPFAEQRKWVGKLCRFWTADGRASNYISLLKRIDDDDTPFVDDNWVCWEHCEPVKPDDDIVYRGE